MIKNGIPRDVSSTNRKTSDVLYVIMSLIILYFLKHAIKVAITGISSNN